MNQHIFHVKVITFQSTLQTHLNHSNLNRPLLILANAAFYPITAPLSLLYPLSLSRPRSSPIDSSLLADFTSAALQTYLCLSDGPSITSVSKVLLVLTHHPPSTTQSIHQSGRPILAVALDSSRRRRCLDGWIIVVSQSQSKTLLHALSSNHSYKFPFLSTAFIFGTLENFKRSSNLSIIS